MAECVVLDPAPAFVELRVGQLDHVERVRHLGRPEHHAVEDRAIGAGEVQGGVVHLVPPRPSLRFEPFGGRIYWPDRISRWHPNDEITPGTVDEMLAEIESDPISIFWG